MKKLIITSNFFFLIVTTFLLIACNNNGTTGITKEGTSQKILDRGNYLVHSVVNCVDCHSQLDMNKFSLPVVPGTEGGGGLALHELLPEDIPGKIFVSNITPYVLKDWSDEEIARAITKGINKKGDTLFPVMPYHGLSRMAKEDVEAVIAYIRTLKPIENKIPDRQLFEPAAVYGSLPDNDYKNNIMPDSNDKVKYGEYLVTIGHCTDCHTPLTKEKMPDTSKYLSGGRHFKTPGFTVIVANITPDPDYGIGSWTEEAFLTKFRTNASKENLETTPGRLNTIMPWSFFGTMTDHDLKCIYAYLRTIKPVSN